MPSPRWVGGGSEPQRQRDGAELVGALALAAELVGAHGEAEGEAEAFAIGHGGTGGEIRDEGLLRHVTAALEGVAVEEDVARDQPILIAGEEVPAEARILEIAGAHIIGAVERGLNAGGAVIEANMPADPHHGADLAIGEDVAEAQSRLGNGVDREAVAELLHEAPFMRAGEDEARLVAQLMVPADGAASADELVPGILHILGIGLLADDADLQRETIETGTFAILVPRLVEQRRAEIEPAGIGPVAAIRIGDMDVGRSEDALAELEIEPRRGEEPAQHLVTQGLRPAAGRGVLARGAEIGKPHAMGVMAVAVALDRVVLDD